MPAARRGCCLGRLVQLALMLLLLLIALPYVARWLADPGPTSDGSAAPAPTSSPWPTDLIPGAPTQAASTAGSTAASGTAYPGGTASPSSATSYPPAVITGRECGRSGTGPYAAAAAGNDSTSCAFAVAVRSAYLDSGRAGTATTITAHSQARNADVTMRCRTRQPVRCDSGDGATVYLYGGEAVLR